MTVLYCGDTTLDTAASYLAGLLARAAIPFHYVPSDQPLEASLLASPWSLVIFSDYPATRLTAEHHAAVVERVLAGAGLLMIGGWESFHGLGGDWDGTAIGDLLPVTISSTDDRWNCDRPLIVCPREPHAITAELPWRTRPPLVGGLSRVMAREEDHVLLTAEEFQLQWHDDAPRLSPLTSHPLLITGARGRGRVAVFTSDVAPHWVGPLVDWGPERVTAQAPGAPGIEVGNLYAELFTRLVSWTAGQSAVKLNGAD